MPAPRKMTKDEMKQGFLQGRRLTQEEWADPGEIADVDNLIADGYAKVVLPWGYQDNFQCSVRKVQGIKK